MRERSIEMVSRSSPHFSGRYESKNWTISNAHVRFLSAIRKAPPAGRSRQFSLRKFPDIGFLSTPFVLCFPGGRYALRRSIRGHFFSRKFDILSSLGDFPTKIYRQESLNLNVTIASPFSSLFNARRRVESWHLLSNRECRLLQSAAKRCIGALLIS